MSEWKLVITGDGEVRDAEGRLLDGEGNRVEATESTSAVHPEQPEHH